VVLIAVIIVFFVGVIGGLTVGKKILMITAIKTKPPTVTPRIKPTKNTNDYSNQSLVFFYVLFVV
jgi:chorismate synthase